MATVTRSRIAGGRPIEARSTRDRGLLLDFLRRDRVFAGYAIADLDDREFARTRWGLALEEEQPIAVAMEYRGLSPQPLFVMGEPEGVRAALEHIIHPRVAYLAAKPEAIRAIGDIYRAEAPAEMVRMVVDGETFRPIYGEAVRLDAGDTRHLNRLYGLGLTAWLPSESVASGLYYGVRRGTRLISAAGTHVISPMYGIAAVGNVYTDREHRGQGLAKVVTSAVTAELLRSVSEVVLNVRADNPSALAAYRAIGYREHGRFEERLVHRRSSLWDSILWPVRRYLPTTRRDG